MRESLEGGSLNFYLKANVQRAGRYVASARVDDANGVPFALLQFNDEVAAGARHESGVSALAARCGGLPAVARQFP